MSQSTDAIQPSLSGGGGSPRLHGFDALRAFAALLVIMLHAGIAYTLVPMPGLVWPTHDANPSVLVDGVFWAVEGFIMPLFFLIAGFFAAGLFESLGPGKFILHRLRRLIVPLLFGIVFILPLDLYIWVFGWVADGRVPLRKLQSLKFDGEIEGNLWGLSHLWFLQYLMLYCFVLRVTRLVIDWLEPTRTGKFLGLVLNAENLDRLFQSRWKPLLLAIPGAIVLWFAPQVVTGFQHGWVPFPSKFLYTVPFFLGGVWMYRFRDRLPVLTRWSGIYLAAAAVLYAAVLPLIHEHLAAELTGGRRVLLAASISVFAWLTVLGLVGVFLRTFDRPYPALQYVSAASFWIYLAHHPVVGLVQVDLAPTSLPAGVKFSIVTATVFAFTLLTYHAWVRGKVIGVILGEKRRPRRQRELAPAASGDVGDKTAVATAESAA